MLGVWRLSFQFSPLAHWTKKERSSGEAIDEWKVAYHVQTRVLGFCLGPVLYRGCTGRFADVLSDRFHLVGDRIARRVRPSGRMGEEPKVIE